MKLGLKLGLAGLVLFAAGAFAAQEGRSQGWGDAMRGMKECVMSMMAGDAPDGSMMGDASGRNQSAMGGGMMGGGKMGDEMMGGGAGTERPNDQWRRNAPGASAPGPATHGSQ